MPPALFDASGDLDLLGESGGFDSLEDLEEADQPEDFDQSKEREETEEFEEAGQPGDIAEPDYETVVRKKRHNEWDKRAKREKTLFRRTHALYKDHGVESFLLLWHAERDKYHVYTTEAGENWPPTWAFLLNRHHPRPDVRTANSGGQVIPSHLLETALKFHPPNPAPYRPEDILMNGFGATAQWNGLEAPAPNRQPFMPGNQSTPAKNVAPADATPNQTFPAQAPTPPTKFSPLSFRAGKHRTVDGSQPLGSPFQYKSDQPPTPSPTPARGKSYGNARTRSVRTPERSAPGTTSPRTPTSTTRRSGRLAPAKHALSAHSNRVQKAVSRS